MANTIIKIQKELGWLANYFKRASRKSTLISRQPEINRQRDEWEIPEVLCI